jgi:Low psii accumulation1 / Rep27
LHKKSSHGTIEKNLLFLMSQQSERLRESDPEKYARLKSEAAAPYRGLRKFIYLSFGASGAIGGFVFLAQTLAGRDVETAIPNLALQIGVVALMVWLFRFESRKD